MVANTRYAACSSVLPPVGLARVLAGPAPKKQGDWTDNLKVENPDAEPDLSGLEDEPDPKAEKPKPEAKPDTKLKTLSGRPLIQYGPSKKIESTFGASPGSKLTLTGGVTLVLPEGALDGGYNILWQFASGSAPTNGSAKGGVAMIKVNPGTKLKAKKVQTDGAPFEIRMSYQGDTLNLAVGSVETDKNGTEQGKPTWTVLAPAKTDTAVTVGDSGEGEKKTSTYELQAIGPVMYIHATTDAAG